MGHIIRWREAGNDPSAARFTWDIFVQAGDPDHGEPLKRGTTQGRVRTARWLYVDPRGVLWIQTDSAGAQHGN